MSRWMSGNGSDRTARSERSQGLVRGVLDFELDIGVVGDVDPDPLKLGRSPVSSEIIDSRAFALAPEHWLSIQGGEFGQSLFIGHTRVELPPEWKNPDFPFVRGLPDGTILVSDTTFDRSHEKNTWLLSRKGEVLAHFGIGSAAVEIAPLEGGLIAVAYHPLSAQKFGHRVEPQQRTAIGFFDRHGKLLTTFNHEAGRSNISAENVRCMTRISPLELVFIPERLINRGQEVENPVVFYHCATGRTVVFSAPFGGAEAVSVARGADGESWLLLASPEGFEDQVIAFDPARKMSQYLGAFNGIFRGLSGFVSTAGSGSRTAAGNATESFPELAIVDNKRGGSNGADTSFSKDTSATVAGNTLGLLSGGFLAQEVVAEYNWILADSEALPSRGVSAFDDSDRSSDLSYSEDERGPDL